ncbi:MAG: DUF1624 domain-containing protein [Corallococcus sp.]|nr:DUF1624 domain-containing protein [Bacillota bacterium]MCM1533878.1 DUF1624 domain-containing protein [Corallococcus sp.]
MKKNQNTQADCIDESNVTSDKSAKSGKFKGKIKNFFTYNVEGKRPRIWELDLLRGLIMLGVTFDHVCRFSYYWGIIQFKTAFGKAIESVAVAYLNSYFCNNAYPYFLWLLCFMSGISCQFSHSSVSRLIKFWVFSAVFMGGYLALHFIIPNLITGYVIFNIVAVLTISVTVWFILDKLNVPDVARIILGAVIAVAGLTLFYCNRFVGDGIFVKNEFLALLIYNKNGYIVSPNNFEPLIPHLGFFILGGVFGKRFYRDKTTKLKRQTPPKWLSPLMLLGKHSLAAYLFLPAALIGVLWLLVNFVGLFL